MKQYLEGFLDTIESFLTWFSTALKQTTESYCDLETADSIHTFAAHDGSLMSIIQFEGATQLVGTQEWQEIHQTITSNLQNAFKYKGHSIQMVFHYEPEAVKTHLYHLFAPSQQTSHALQLQLQDLFEARIKHLTQYCSEERTYIAIWTHPSHLNTEQYKQAERNKLKLIRAKALPPFRLTQNLIAAIPEIRHTHDAFVASILNTFVQLKLDAKLLKVHQASHMIRRLADPEWTDPDWQVILPGDKIPLKTYPKHQSHLVDILWPSLARQLLPRDAETLDLRTVRWGDRIYSCVFIDLLPKEIHAFSKLLQRTLPSKMPWRIAFLAHSDALKDLHLKSLLATILSFSSSENRLLSDANNLLHDIALHSDEAIVKLKIVATTWAPCGQMDVLRIRAAELARAIQSWGASDISEISGDPFEGLISTMLGISAKSIGTETILPFSEMVKLLPLTQPATLWSQGSQIFRTLEGKVWPFQPGSSKQTTWIDLIYARPGSGKSVLSNTLNLALCLKGGLKTLPYISIIDIGPSSKGLISLLQESLPLHQRHLVIYHRFLMDTQYAINPFDTPLGARYPSPQERNFLVNFLTLLGTPLGEKSAYEGLADMIGLVIDTLYQRFNDHEKPIHYTAALEMRVDQCIQRLNITIDNCTTWWEVTDALFAHQAIEEAKLAQRHATPLLADVAAICHTTAITDLYGKIILPTGENLIDAFTRMISRAIREYPILSEVTRIDFSQAHIIAVDLGAVAHSGSLAADRQTAIMYMLARQLLTRHFYLDLHKIEGLPQRYVDYHHSCFQKTKEISKRIVFDEFHRTAHTQIVRDQIIADMREGRKWNIQIALISQSLEDFDTVFVELATAIYIMDAGPLPTIEKSARIFGLSSTAKRLLRTHVHGPQAQGSNFLAQFATTTGVHTQILTLSLSPIELWALSTTVEDVMIREELYQTLGPIAARKLLANVFPSGTARTMIETRMLHAQRTSLAEATIDPKSIIDTLVQELLSKHHQSSQAIIL